MVLTQPIIFVKGLLRRKGLMATAGASDTLNFRQAFDMEQVRMDAHDQNTKPD